MGQKRHATERINKYKAKINAGVIGSGYDRTKELAAKKQKTYFEEAAQLESVVKSFVDGEPVFLHHFYIAFAEVIMKLIKHHTASALFSEMDIAEETWRTRGLNDEKLKSIKRYLVEAYTASFQLDISPLDGLDRLR